MARTVACWTKFLCNVLMNIYDPRSSQKKAYHLQADCVAITDATFWGSHYHLRLLANVTAKVISAATILREEYLIDSLKTKAKRSRCIMLHIVE